MGPELIAVVDILLSDTFPVCVLEVGSGLIGGDTGSVEGLFLSFDASTTTAPAVIPMAKVVIPIITK